MGNFKDLAKEEVIKSLIDKLIFGLIAALIVFGVQKCSESSERIKMSKEALLKLESTQLSEGITALKKTFSAYIAEVTEITTFGLTPNEEKKKKLISIRVEIESEMEVMSIYQPRLKDEGKKLIELINQLNKLLIKYSMNSTTDSENLVLKLKDAYKDYLVKVKNLAIETITHELES